MEINGELKNIFKEMSMKGIKQDKEFGFVVDLVDTHAYLYAEKSVFNSNLSEISVFLQVSSPSLVAIAVIFYSGDVRIGGDVLPSNQVGSVSVPAGVDGIVFGLRCSSFGNFNLNSLYVGSKSSVEQYVKKKDLDFSLLFDPLPKLITKNPKIPLIILETVFCDVETDIDIINKYLGFLLRSIELMTFSVYKNYFWVIHVSEDKSDSIALLNERIMLLGLADSVRINIYSHPELGYGNEGETHIDRLKRPNSTFPERREVLFNSYKHALNEDFEKYNIVVRLSLDDDDYFLPNHLLNVSKSVMDNLNTIREYKNIVFGFNRILVAYHSGDGKADVHEVGFSRVLTGCKFSVSCNSVPVSAFSLTEHHLDNVGKVVSGYYYTLVDLDKASYVYNRHGVNFSSSSKVTYYLNEFEKHEDVDFNDFLISKCIV